MTEYGDYSLDTPCPCGGVLDVYIDWNTGDEHVRCRNNCGKLTADWLNTHLRN